MKKLLGVLMLVMSGVTSFADDKAGWTELFDGKSLTGWIQKNGTATYRVENSTIVGKTNEGSPNSFLCSEKDYANFELEFEVKCAVELNSGVQIRSKTAEAKGDEKFGRVNGPQVEIEANKPAGSVAGYVYGEATKFGWLTAQERLKPHKNYKDNDWNKYRVVAKGPRIQTWINGEAIEDLTHDEIFKTHATGFIGLQVHGIKKGTGPYEVAWRNIRIKVLE